MTEDQIKHMVDRFLGWHLPENFNPDNGIVVVARWTYKAVVQFRKDLHSKPTPWLGLPWGP